MDGMTDEDTLRYLQPSATIEAEHPLVKAFVQRHLAGVESEIDRAVTLFYAVRDGIRYDAYRIDVSIEGLKASATLKNGYGWCVSKAILLAACLRGIGIPAPEGGRRTRAVRQGR